MSAELETQLIELQTQLAFQEDLLSALNERVIAQDKSLRDVRQILVHMQESNAQLQASMENRGTAGDIEKPPHY